MRWGARVVLAAVALTQTVLLPLVAAETAASWSIPADSQGDSVQDSPAQSQGDSEQDLPAGAGRIIGSPQPGPDPESSGDRGGWAQLLTLGALAVGISFIMWRIVRAARRAPGSSAARP